MNDIHAWAPYGTTLHSRFFLGTAGYPSPAILQQAIAASGAQVVTVGLKRMLAGQPSGQNGFMDIIQQSHVHLLPNTAGCTTAREAITLAHMARELYDTRWVKLEVVGDDYTLQPDPWGTLEAARQLIQDGFDVFPFCTDDLVSCLRLLDVGCQVLMPWAAPIGSGQGLLNPYALKTLRTRCPNVPIIVDAGLGTPSHAAQVMEMGLDGVLLNSAVSQARDPVLMAQAFSQAIQAGRSGFVAGLMPMQDMATASTPVTGSPFVLP